MIYYRVTAPFSSKTPIPMFNRPTNGKSLLIGEDGDNIILVESPSRVILPVSEYSWSQIKEGEFAGLLQKEIVERVVALYETASLIFKGQITFVLYETFRSTASNEEGGTVDAQCKFGLAALSWFPEELIGCERSYLPIPSGLIP